LVTNTCRWLPIGALCWQTRRTSANAQRGTRPWQVRQLLPTSTRPMTICWPVSKPAESQPQVGKPAPAEEELLAGDGHAVHAAVEDDEKDGQLLIDGGVHLRPQHQEGAVAAEHHRPRARRRAFVVRRAMPLSGDRVESAPRARAARGWEGLRKSEVQHDG